MHAQGAPEVSVNSSFTFKGPTTLRDWDFVMYTSTVPHL